LLKALFCGFSSLNDHFLSVAKTKPYGDFVIDLQTVPQPLEGAMTLPEESMGT
jgi:hypothetical protein